MWHKFGFALCCLSFCAVLAQEHTPIDVPSTQKPRAEADEIEIRRGLTAKANLNNALGVDSALSEIRLNDGTAPQYTVLFFFMAGCPATEKVVEFVKKMEAE